MQFLLRNQSIFLVQDWTFWRKGFLGQHTRVFETFFCKNVVMETIYVDVYLTILLLIEYLEGEGVVFGYLQKFLHT